MANTYKIPSPADLLKAAQPRTGPPVPNMGGIPTQGMAAQRPNFAALPSINSAPPGPAPAAQPVTPPAAPAPAPAATAAPATATAPAGPPVFNFNFGGATVGGEMWPNAQRPQGVGGEMWPNATAPTPPTTAGGEMWPDASAPKPGEMWPDAQAPAIPEVPYRVTATVPHVPRPWEVASLAPGEGRTTPVGDVFRDAATGRLKLKLNEAGKVAYRQKEQERLKSFGTYPMSHDPLAPTPDVTPGQPVFNPFTGTWL